MKRKVGSGDVSRLCVRDVWYVAVVVCGKLNENIGELSRWVFCGFGFGFGCLNINDESGVTIRALDYVEAFFFHLRQLVFMVPQVEGIKNDRGQTSRQACWRNDIGYKVVLRNRRMAIPLQKPNI